MGEKKKSDLDPKKVEVIDKVADFVVKRNLDVIAIMTIESMRPLHFIGSQVLLFFEPFLTILVHPEKMRLFREALEESKYIDYILDRIENPPKEKKEEEKKEESEESKNP